MPERKFPEPKRGEFIIQSFEPEYMFRGEFGDGAPTPTADSYGGWQIVEIPKRMGLTEFAGRNPYGIEIEFLVDRFEEGKDRGADHVERNFANLERIAGRNSEDDDPPIFVIDSNGHIPHDFTRNPRQRWVVESLNWDKELTIISVERRPLRLGGTLVIRQYNHDTSLGSYDGPAERNRKKHRKKGDKGRTTTKKLYTVKKGDTLSGIAQRELGDSKRWREIADANDIRDPRSIKVGQKLRLPK